MRYGRMQDLAHKAVCIRLQFNAEEGAFAAVENVERTAGGVRNSTALSG
jgi:hypothetical protein